jgi:hypothetical protein
MVGKRNWPTGFGDGRKGDNAKKEDKDSTHQRIKPAALRFQDASNKALEDERREQIKNRLIDSVERDQLEEYRKSKDEVCTLCHCSRSYTNCVLR